MPILGKSKYFEFSINNCLPSDTYIITGKKIKRGEVGGIAGCKCGDGYCGMGEDELNCPSDCTVFMSEKKVYLGLYFLGLIIFLSVTIIIRGVSILKKRIFVRKKERGLYFLLKGIEYYAKNNKNKEAGDLFLKAKLIYEEISAVENYKKIMRSYDMINWFFDKIKQKINNFDEINQNTKEIL